MNFLPCDSFGKSDNSNDDDDGNSNNDICTGNHDSNPNIINDDIDIAKLMKKNLSQKQ